MAEKKQWVVRANCEVVKEWVVECTEEDAWNEPLEHIISEDEKSVDNWDVKSVEPNE